jgi:hypothetical protein
MTISTKEKKKKKKNFLYLIFNSFPVHHTGLRLVIFNGADSRHQKAFQNDIKFCFIFLRNEKIESKLLREFIEKFT